MLKDQRVINLEIDKPLYTPIFAKQADNARYLLFNILSNGVPFALTGRTVRVYATKPDNTKIFNDLVIINALNGQAELALTTQILAVVGNVNMELVIYEGTSILSTTVFTLEVQATNRSDSAVVSTNEFSVLTNAIANADSAKQTYINGASALETTYAPRLTGLEAKGFIPDNLLLGSDFEKPISNGFIAYGGMQLSLSTDYFYHGSQSLKMIAAQASGGALMVMSNEIMNLCKGKKVTFSFKVRGIGSSIGKEINAVIGWTVTGAYGTKVALTDVWQTIYVTTTLPANTSKMELYMNMDSAVAGDIIYADYAKLELNDTVGIWKPNSEDLINSLLDKQAITDNNLKTVDKTTTGAINELKASGEVSYFARSTPPVGWLKANGALISRTTYANLFSAIGTTFGAGDGSTTFALPDLRGEFIRGFDDGAGIDSGRTFGSNQTDTFKTHSHPVSYISLNSPGGSGVNYFTPTVTGMVSNTSTTGDTETRPKNIALLACIRY